MTESKSGSEGGTPSEISAMSIAVLAIPSQTSWLAICVHGTATRTASTTFALIDLMPSETKSQTSSTYSTNASNTSAGLQPLSDGGL